MAAVSFLRLAESLSLKTACGCKKVRWASRLAAKISRSRVSPTRSSKQAKHVKPVKQTVDLKTALTRHLEKRRDFAKQEARKINVPSLKQRKAVGEDSISKGRREIIIEPSCSENPAFTSEENSKVTGHSFRSLGLREDVLNGMKDLSISKPTMIQRMAIPLILKREHVLCAAQTGTGKTLAYLSPIVHHLREEQDQGVISRLNRPRALIVLPNRELAFQVLKVAKSLSHNARFRSALLTGGRKLRVLKSGFESPVDLLVGTPGTLLEFLERGRLFLSDVSYLVIDEADSMFDKTFKNDTMQLLETINIRQDKPSHRSSLPKDAQVTVVCATLPEEFFEDTLQDILPHLQACTSSHHRILPHVRHKFVKIPQNDKPEKLLELLREDLSLHNRRTVVFCNTTPSCDFIGHYLTNNGISHIKLHSTIAIEERSNLFKDFQEEKERILVCTDVGSRGLDTNVNHVINFDFPISVTDYIHRVGRTGRVRTVPRQDDVAMATSLMSHNRDVRMALAIEEAARKNQCLKSIEVRNLPKEQARHSKKTGQVKVKRSKGTVDRTVLRRKSRDVVLQQGS
ncbi:uncharacterized protein [Porites lutea]|uniref:uncharacterized protein isoform X1 n=1 Tax=Porites lutea TaxID=51062 RepID=UPI003CC67372